MTQQELYDYINDVIKTNPLVSGADKTRGESMRQVLKEIVKFAEETSPDLGVATSVTLGGVKIGAGLDITTDGTLSTEDNLSDAQIAALEGTEGSPSTTNRFVTNQGLQTALTSVETLIEDNLVADITLAYDATGEITLTGLGIENDQLFQVSINLPLGSTNGFATLDGNGKLNLTQVPDSLLGQVKFKGTINAGTNIITSSDPDLNNQPLPAASAANQGWYFMCNTSAGTVAGIELGIGDWIISNGTAGWGKVDNTDAVMSVNGQTGTVSITAGTLGLGNVNNTSDIDKPVSEATQIALNLKQDKSLTGYTINTSAKFNPTASDTVLSALGKLDARSSVVLATARKFSNTNGWVYSTSVQALTGGATDTEIIYQGRYDTLTTAATLFNAILVGQWNELLLSQPLHMTGGAALRSCIITGNGGYLNIYAESGYAPHNVTITSSRVGANITIASGCTLNLDNSTVLAGLTITNNGTLVIGQGAGIQGVTITGTGTITDNRTSNLLRNYTKASIQTAVAATDTLLAALGKLEKKADDAINNTIAYVLRGVPDTGSNKVRFDRNAHYAKTTTALTSAHFVGAAEPTNVAGVTVRLQYAGSTAPTFPADYTIISGGFIAGRENVIYLTTIPASIIGNTNGMVEVTIGNY